VPQEFHDSPALRVALLGIHNPIPEMVIIAQRPLPDLILRHGELCTARSAYFDRELAHIRRSPTKDVFPHIRCDVGIVSMRLQATGVPIASQIDVAIALHKRELQRAQSVDIIVKWRVSMPGSEEAIAVRVEEGESRRESVIVVYDVGEVGHGFMAFIHWGCKGAAGVGRRIDRVDCGLPAVLMVSGSSNQG